MASAFLITNGPIWTGDPAQPWAQAVVVRGRDLVHVGTRAGADGFVDARNHLASMALSKLGVSVAGIVGRDAVLAKIREWVAAQPADAQLRDHAWMPDSFEERSPRREWLDEITGDRPMYLFSADAHDPGAQYWVRDPDRTQIMCTATGEMAEAFVAFRERRDPEWKRL